MSNRFYAALTLWTGSKSFIGVLEHPYRRGCVKIATMVCRMLARLS